MLGPVELWGILKEGLFNMLGGQTHSNADI